MNKKFIINPDYVFRDVLDEAVLVNTKTKLCINLNETGTFIVKSIINNIDSSKILADMINTFEINPESAKVDLENFIADLQEKNILISI